VIWQGTMHCGQDPSIQPPPEVMGGPRHVFQLGGLNSLPPCPGPEDDA
jgi:hypothetical protein